MNGKIEKTAETDQQCAHCGMWFTPQGIYNHESNCPLEGLEARVLPPDDEQSPTTESVGGDSSPEPPDGESQGLGPESPGQASVTEQSTGSDRRDDDQVVTDGAGLGLGGPPSSGPATGGSRSRADLPDRYVTVDEWLGTVREQGDQVTVGDQVVDVDVLEEQLSEYDVVDVEGTSSEEIVAYPLDEVPA